MNAQLSSTNALSFDLETIKLKSDKIIGAAMWIYFGFGIAISFVYDTQLIALGVGGLCLAAYFLVKALMPQSNLYQYVAGVVLALFMAQFIYQMHGLLEMHFFAFIASLLLITYQNWKLQIPVTLTVVVHHSLFAWLQYAGNKEIYFTQLEYMDLQTFVFHAGLAAVIFGISGYWAYDLRKATERAAENTENLQKQLANVNNNILFAEEISKGNLHHDYELKDNGDELGASLIKMRESLLLAGQREQEEKFISLGINKIAEILRSNTDGIEQLSDALIRGLVKYLNINQGAIFIVEGEGEQQGLELKACFAYERKKFLEKRIGVNEGLVGQCFLEKEMIYLTDVPDNYIRITSGLGDAPPSAVLLMPVKTADEIVGVIELASFVEFSPNHIEFIKKACENIASAIISAHTTDKIKALLEDSQMQTEEMRAQEEEMRQNMEELQATQEEMEKQKLEMEGYLKGIYSTMAYIEFNTDGVVQTANELFQKAMGYNLGEIVGKHHRMFVTQEYAVSDDYQQMWSDLKDGKIFQAEVHRVKKSGEAIWLMAVYFPIFNAMGEVAKVTKIAVDITETKKLQRSALLQAETLKEKEEELRQNLEEITKVQQELERMNLEIEEIRLMEKERAENQINSQKKIMEQYVQRAKEKETSLELKIKELQEQIPLN
jgi:methyl-accepting chemotaxis protein